MSGLPSDIPVIATASHDTASAVTAVPTDEQEFVFISCGTWSLLGTVTEKPILSDGAFEEGFSNEGMPEGKIKFLKNIMGLWMIQECRRLWSRQGEALSFDELERAASESAPFRAFLDAEDSCFANPDNMEEAVIGYCRRSGQPIPESKGEILRCIYESLAMKYRYSVERLEELTGRRFDRIHIIGGGCRDRLLCGFTADASGREVIAGPSEATALGNGINQLIGLGAIASVAEGRRLLRRGQKTERFLPRGKEAWDRAYERYLAVIGKTR